MDATPAAEPAADTPDVRSKYPWTVHRDIRITTSTIKASEPEQMLQCLLKADTLAQVSLVQLSSPPDHDLPGTCSLKFLAPTLLRWLRHGMRPLQRHLRSAGTETVLAMLGLNTCTDELESNKARDVELDERLSHVIDLCRMFPATPTIDEDPAWNLLCCLNGLAIIGDAASTEELLLRTCYRSGHCLPTEDKAMWADRLAGLRR